MVLALIYQPIRRDMSVLFPLGGGYICNVLEKLLPVISYKSD